MKLTTLVLVLGLFCVVVIAEAAHKPHFPFSKAKVQSNAVLDSRLPPYSTYWYTQTLDHFNFANTGTFQQRYLVVGTYGSLWSSVSFSIFVADVLDSFVA